MCKSRPYAETALLRVTRVQHILEETVQRFQKWSPELSIHQLAMQILGSIPRVTTASIQEQDFVHYSYCIASKSSLLNLLGTH